MVSFIIDNRDMSAYIKKIHFKLHDSYANPNRIVTKAPYEVTETGWGEFEVVIKIYFHDPTERPTTMYHILKLFQSPVVGDSNNTSGLSDNKLCLVSEQYEEIVFQEPTQLMQQLLTNIQPITDGVWEHSTDWENKKITTLQHINDTKVKIKDEITKLKDRLKLARETIAHFKNEIAKVQKNEQG